MAIIENALGIKCVLLNGRFPLNMILAQNWGLDAAIPYPEKNVWLKWDGQGWLAENNSANAVKVAGTDLKPGGIRRLAQHDEIHLGDPWYSRWRMLDLGPPGNNTVYMADDVWSVRTPLQSMRLNDGDVVATNQCCWCLCAMPPLKPADTGAADAVSPEQTPLIKFDVSLDEEHVFASIEVDHQAISLAERVHHYLLVTLARARLRDRRAGIDRDNCGWVEMHDLCKMLNLDAAHINIQIYRARKQLTESFYGEYDLPDLVERRLGSVRLGAWRFTIKRGSRCDESL